MAGELKILDTNLKSEEIMNFYLIFLQILMHLSTILPYFALIFYIFHKRYLIGEVLKHIFFWNLRFAKVLAVEGYLKPQNMIFF